MAGGWHVASRGWRGEVQAVGRQRVWCERWGGVGYGAGRGYGAAAEAVAGWWAVEAVAGWQAASGGWIGCEGGDREVGRHRGEEGRWAGGKT
ncbi:hypothetical protein GUJ93_ZPchr0015g6859 [Zizania palustris]|uniref:Uncharacterized protein n=1 Tax=Zizania palustris TaxID=103762 RepID=A0A8J5SYI5_ZIZPA|nr:hypothetical protein GUJ93_ZPchr0015g6859 [Zizania palustris]